MNTFEIGDLVTYSLRGRQSLCISHNDPPSVGIVVGKGEQNYSNLVRVKWFHFERITNTHIHYLKKLEQNT